VKIMGSTLVSLARHEAERRGKRGDIISGYLIGSVARGDDLLGGTTDIDLVLIHRNPPGVPREMVYLSDEVHLDILHHDRGVYQQPRDLRVHPWIGPSMCEPLFLYDPEHFFERAQAGARGQFFRLDHVHQRARAFIHRARQTRALLAVTDRWLKSYCHSAIEAVNAAACLTGFPAAGRRVILDLQGAMADLGSPELLGMFLQLIGADRLSAWDLPAVFGSWAKAFDAATERSNDAELARCRRAYYLNGFQALAEGDQPRAVTWTLLTSWERSVFALDSKPETLDHRIAWADFLKDLNLSPEYHGARSEQLDAFIDQVEVFIEEWSENVGA
jgi:hypothetical protein